MSSHSNSHKIITLQNLALFLFVGSATGFLVMITEPFSLIALGAGLALLTAVMQDRLNGLLALAALSFINTSYIPVLFEISTISVRLHDVIIGILIGALLIEILITGRLRIPHELKDVFIPVMLFMLYGGLTLINVAISFPEHLAASTTSFLRLLQYVCLVPLVSMVLRDERQLTRFLKVFVILGIVSVGIAVVQRMAGTSLLTYQLSMGVLAGKKRAGALLGS
ncbi:MAG: hypothetical protein ACW963_06050, partial [Candidatus Sifarchaeia archaeon]